MIAMTTSNSTNVKPDLPDKCLDRISMDLDEE